MNTFRDSTDRQKTSLQVEGSILVDTYLLFAISAVIIVTTIVQMISLFQNNQLLMNVANGLLIVVSFTSIAVAWWRSSIAINHSQKQSVSVSAAFGSFLSALVSVVFAASGSVIWLVVLGMCIVIAAICIIGIIVLLLLPDGEAPQRAQSSVNAARSQPAVFDDYDNDTYQRTHRRKPSSVELGSQRQSESQLYQSHTPTPAQHSAMYPQVNTALPPEEPVNPSPPPLPIVIPKVQEPSLGIVPSPTLMLRSLFEDDGLYSIPNSSAKVRLLIVTKSNDILDNCEDACAISEEKNRFALCDGVSNSRFARPWAKLLAEQWVTEPLMTNDVELVGKWLEEPRSRWRAWVSNTWLEKINARNRSMGRIEFTPDDVKKFFTQGAAATFLGITLDEKTSTWTALSVGDTCLFHCSRNSTGAWKCKAFPYKSAEEFNDEPDSITSRSNTAHIVASNIKQLSQQPYVAGDILLMATDALAEWILKYLEQNEAGKIVNYFERLNAEQFKVFINEERRKKTITDDDTTLIIIH